MENYGCFCNYRPQGEGNVFTGVCLSTIGLITTVHPCYCAVGTDPTGMLSCYLIHLVSVMAHLWYFGNKNVLETLIIAGTVPVNPLPLSNFEE